MKNSKKFKLFTLASVHDWLNSPITKLFVSEVNIQLSIIEKQILDKKFDHKETADSIAMQLIHFQGIRHILQRLKTPDALKLFLNYYIKYPEYKEKPEREDDDES